MKVTTLAKLMVFCLPMSVLGLFFIYASWGAAQYDAAVIKTGVQTVGKVIKKEKYYSRGPGMRNPDTTYSLEYEFSLPDGQTVAGRSIYPHIWAQFNEGDAVTILYDQDNPSRNFPPGGEFSKPLAIGLMVMGFLVQLPLVGVLVYFFKNRGEEES